MEPYPNIILTDKELVKRNKEENLYLSTGFIVDKGDAIHTKDLNKCILAYNDQMYSKFIKFANTDRKYKGSADEYEIWNTIKSFRDKLKTNGNDPKRNMIDFPADYYTLYQAIMTDLTRVRAEEPDWTAQLTNEQIRLDAPNPMPLREMLEFAGKMEKYVVGQPVPLIQEKTGATENIEIELYDIGYTRSLYSVLFDVEIFQMQKILRAVARAHRGLRNFIAFNPILSATFHASQIVPADTTGATYDEQMYNTWLAAYILLSGLLDTQTGQEIATPRIVALVRNRAIAWVVNRIVFGGLVPSQASTPRVFAPLDISEIWTYKGDSWTWGKETVSYPGVSADKGYLLVPGSAGSPFYTITKAPLTQEVGRGGVLTHGQEERAWYMGQGHYHGEFMGSSGVYKAQFVSGYGYIVEVNLPSSTPTT